MPLPVTLGEDTYTYVFGVLGSTLGLTLFGMVDLYYNLSKNGDQQVYSPIGRDRNLFMTQTFSLLIHIAVFGMLIFNYIDSWKNAKDNVFLVLMTIVLALNLADFFYKSIRYSRTEYVMYEGRRALFIIHIMGFMAFVTATFAYAWVGTFADQVSTSRDVVLTSGVIVIFVFAIGMLNFYKFNRSAKIMIDRLIKNTGKQLSVTKRSGVETKIFHAPHEVRGLDYPLTDDNPDTPLLLHAADRARHSPVPGVNADNWKVLKYEGEHYLVSPQTAQACLELQSKWTGKFETDTNHSGDLQFWLHNVYKPEKSGIKVPVLSEIHNESMFVGYDVFYNKVHGWAGGIGIFFAVHYLLPLSFTVYMFAWYSLYLQQFTAACLASAITLAVPLLGSVIGFAGQYWELFRWYFLIGWSIINLVNYIVANNFKYIRQQSTWNVTDIPVQEFPEFTTADQSLNILGYAWTSFAWGTLALVIIIAELLKKYCVDKGQIDLVQPAKASTKEKFSKEEATSLLKPDDSNLVRRAKYLSVKQ